MSQESHTEALYTFMKSMEGQATYRGAHRLIPEHERLMVEDQKV